MCVCVCVRTSVCVFYVEKETIRMSWLLLLMETVFFFFILSPVEEMAIVFVMLPDAQSHGIYSLYSKSFHWFSQR